MLRKRMATVVVLVLLLWRRRCSARIGLEMGGVLQRWWRIGVVPLLLLSNWAVRARMLLILWVAASVHQGRRGQAAAVASCHISTTHWPPFMGVRVPIRMLVAMQWR